MESTSLRVRFNYTKIYTKVVFFTFFYFILLLYQFEYIVFVEAMFTTMSCIRWLI